MASSENAALLCALIAELDTDGAWSSSETQTLQALIQGLRYSPEMHALLAGIATGITTHFAELARPMREET